MGVLDGRRLKYSPTGADGTYEVAAVSTSQVLAPVWVLLGRVVRDRRSTDSRIAGTRLRRPGKGAVVWRAEVPRAQWIEGTGRIPAGQLQGNARPNEFRLEWRGQAWDRREDAALALAAWHDQHEGEAK